MIGAHLYQESQKPKMFDAMFVRNEKDDNDEASEDEFIETQYLPLLTKSIMVRNTYGDKLETVEESSVNFDDSPDRDNSYYLRDLPDFTETELSPQKQSQACKQALDEL